MAWHKPYNVSGTVHCDDGLDAYCKVVRRVVGASEVPIIGHYTGATTIAASSEAALFISTGFDIHEFYACVPGERDHWLRFGAALEEALLLAGVPYSLVVHFETMNEHAS